MMKLYFSPGACSLASHIVAREAGIDLALDKVDRAKKTESGEDFLAINPKGYVPALALDDGELLTEGPVIMQYLADRKPESGLAPPPGSMERYRLQETLGFINSELHKSYSPLFSPTVLPEVRVDRIAYLKKRYAILERQLGGHPYLFGDRFSVADAYLFTITNWARGLKIDLAEFPNLTAFQARVAERPAVHAAMQREGLVS